MYGMSNMEAYITVCKIDSQQEFAVLLRKLKQGLWINLEGWDGEGGERSLKKEGICVYLWLIWASLVAQRLKCLPAMRETRVQSLGWEDPLEMEMATHYSILAWRIAWMEELGRLQSTGSQRVGHN